MKNQFDRRSFLEMGTAATVGLSVAGQRPASASSGKETDSNRTVRIGLIGSGNRGCSLLSTLLGMENLAFPAICDIHSEHLAKAQEMVV